MDQIYLRTTIGVDRDIEIMPHFLSHYKNLGVRNFIVILHALDKASPNLEKAKTILREHEISPADIWVTRRWRTKTNEKKLTESVCHLPDDVWLITADVDEFQEYPMPVESFVQMLSENNYDVVQGRLVDRIDEHWRLKKIDPEVNIFEQFPKQVDSKVGDKNKIMLHRRYIKTSPGQHKFSNNDPDRAVSVYPGVMSVHHFKWDSGIVEKYLDSKKIAHHPYEYEYLLNMLFILRHFKVPQKNYIYIRLFINRYTIQTVIKKITGRI